MVNTISKSLFSLRSLESFSKAKIAIQRITHHANSLPAWLGGHRSYRSRNCRRDLGRTDLFPVVAVIPDCGSYRGWWPGPERRYPPTLAGLCQESCLDCLTAKRSRFGYEVVFDSLLTGVFSNYSVYCTPERSISPYSTPNNYKV